jgi:hypothetical protein
MLGGTLVTAASNGGNQIWERELDKLMKRTTNRPLPRGWMSIKEAYIVCAFSLVIGTFLLYLINWYWGRLECRLLLQTQGGLVKERLEKALELVLILKATSLSFSSEKRLQHIVIHEAPKVFLTKAVDSDHQTGYHSIYTEIVRYISDLVRAYQPACKYPEMLVSTLLEGSLQQRFFSQHLPEVTNASEQEDAVAVFYTQLFFSFLDHE